MQIKSAYDKDFRKLADICEVAIAKANQANQGKMLSNMSVQSIHDEMGESQSNRDTEVMRESLTVDQSVDCTIEKITRENTDTDKLRVPKIPTDAGNRLNNQLLFEKLQQLEDQVVSASIQNKKINQIKQFNQTNLDKFKPNDIVDEHKSTRNISDHEKSE